MSAYWDNLRPFEKRLVAGFAVLFFIVLNVLFVFPHFSDLSAAHDRRDEALRKLARYENEIAQTNLYMAGLRKFQQENSEVLPEEQSLQFANTVNAQAGQSGAHILSGSHINTQTNQFFLEKNQSVSVQAGEQQLVDFLYNLGAGNSQIRVRDLSVRPDPPRQQLLAQVKLVASYQKKTTARTSAPTHPAAIPSSRAPAAQPPTGKSGSSPPQKTSTPTKKP
jgi:type II secretory pathway component PulM